MRRILLIITVVLITRTGCAAPMFFDIKASSLREALNRWAAQSGLGIVFDWSFCQGQTGALKGALDPAEALEILIRDVDAHVWWENSETAVIGWGRPYCNPAAGADAPLPPCVPPPLRDRS